MNPIHILYVCTGNSCRSVMAHYLTQHWLKEAGLDQVEVSSSGVFAIEGMRASRETEAVLNQAGTTAKGHGARRITLEIVKTADYIFVMEQFQGEEIARNFPEHAAKIHMLKNFGCSEDELVMDPTISDPIGKPMEVYEVCFQEITESVKRVLRQLGVLTK